MRPEAVPVKMDELGKEEESSLPSYQDFISAQCKRHPCLQNLANFFVSSHTRQNPIRINSLEFTSLTNKPLLRSLDIVSLTETLQALKLCSQGIIGRIILVEDISVDVIELLGSCLDIDPLFFASHLSAARSEETTNKPRATVLPSRAEEQTFFNIHYVCAVDFDDWKPEARLLCNTNVRRKISVLHVKNNQCVGIVARCTSVLLRIQDGQPWLCITLVDPEAGATLRIDGAETIINSFIRSRPFQGGYEDFGERISYSTYCAGRLTDPERCSPFDNIVHYWTNEASPLLPTATPSLISLSFYHLRIAAAEWMSVVNLMRFCVEYYEWFIEHEGIYVTQNKLSRLESTLRNLQSWRRRGTSCLLKIHKIEQFILDSNENTPNISALLIDLKHITANAEMYQHRLESMMPTVTSLVQIVDSRRSITETANMTRLTYLALIFVPLTFVSSLFSMSGHLAPGGKLFWVYFVVAIPLLAVIFLIADPLIMREKLSFKISL